MDNQSLIKKTEDISDPLVKKRYIKYFQLPQDLRETMFSVETANRTREISKKNNLNSDQAWWASHTAGMIILGEIKITDFVKIIQKRCKLEETSARQLARDINEAIFLPVKESLKKVYQMSEWPRENKETTTPETHEPRLEGNIVDLKGE